MAKESLKEYRCCGCNKLFFKGNLHNAVIEIKCKRCKKMNLIIGEKSEFTADMSLDQIKM
jgi:phage FluMu protein Com